MIQMVKYHKELLSQEPERPCKLEWRNHSPLEQIIVMQKKYANNKRANSWTKLKKMISDIITTKPNKGFHD